MGFTPNKKNANDFNGGVQYKNGDSLQAESLNHIIEGLLYAQENGNGGGSGETGADGRMGAIQLLLEYDGENGFGYHLYVLKCLDPTVQEEDFDGMVGLVGLVVKKTSNDVDNNLSIGDIVSITGVKDRHLVCNTDDGGEVFGNIRGEKGEKGEQGANGKDGTNGKDGADGVRINFRGEWAINTTYNVGDIVEDKVGAWLYICVKEHTTGDGGISVDPTSPRTFLDEYWQPYTAVGAPNIYGYMPNWKENEDSTVYGLMSFSERFKLDGIESNAQVNKIEKIIKNGKELPITDKAVDLGEVAKLSDISAHNVDTDAHNDIRIFLSELSNRVNALLDSDDDTLNQTSEIVAYIKANKSLIDSITTSKVNVADIVNNLTTNVTNKPLSASQGVVLKALIDSLSQNKLNASELQTAINTALAQAKASGEFKGDKGDTGETGSAGKDGADGAKGADGVGVKSVAQTTTSSADGGSNVITVTLTDGKTSTFTVKNGSKGSTGADGYTPVKGVDYFTEEDKQEIAETVKEQNGIPDYWIAHLDERIEDIRRAMESAGRNKSSFFFYSDSHWSNEDTYTAKLAPSLLKYLYKKTPINKTNYGGDIVSAESTDTDIMAYLWDWREQLRGLPNHHSVIGNHDDGNSTDRLLSKEYIYSYLLAPEENNDIVWGGDFYYYIDDKSENTRYLYLDVFYDKASSEQLAFVSEALKTTPADWHIVAICHAWFGVNYGTVENPIYPPVLNGFETKAKILLDMFDNYNARSGEYSDCGGWVELCIGGHYHLDHYEHTSGGIPVIIVEADTFHDREHPMPTHGNIGESAVSAVVVDYNNKLVKVIRVGRGNSFEVPIEVGEVTYTNVISTSIGSDGKPFNGGQGWASNSRIGSGVINNYIGKGNYCITGLIEINPAINNTIRLRNITFKQTDTSNNTGIAFYNSSYTRINALSGGSGTTWTTPAMISNTGGYSPVLDANKNILEFTLKASQHTTNTAVKYIAICADYIGADSIITINEPID